MTTETHTPFKEHFKDIIIAKNLLAGNTCKNCIHCRHIRSHFHFEKNSSEFIPEFDCTLNNTSTPSNNTCEDYQFNQLVWVTSDIQENQNTKFL